MEEARAQRRVTWKQVSEATGLSTSTLGRYRKDETRYPEATRIIEEYFGWSYGTIGELDDGIITPDEIAMRPTERGGQPSLHATISSRSTASEVLAELGDLRNRIDMLMGRVAMLDLDDVHSHAG